MKQVIVSKERPKQLSFRTSFNVDYEILITRKGKSNVNVKKYALSKVYSNTQGLTWDKIKDLRILCKNNIIPPAYHEYYESFDARQRNEGAAAEEEDVK